MSLIQVERDGPLARIRLNRPEKYNAQTPAMWHEIRRAGEALIADGGVRCLVLSGNGHSFFAGRGGALALGAARRRETTGATR